MFQQVKWGHFHINVFYLKVRVAKRSEGWNMLLNNNLPNTELLLEYCTQIPEELLQFQRIGEKPSLFGETATSAGF